MNALQSLVKGAYDAWEAKGKITRPTLADALDFLATEVAEAIDARLRMPRRQVFLLVSYTGVEPTRATTLALALRRM